MFHIKYETVRPCLHGLKLPHRVFEDSQLRVCISGDSPAATEVSKVTSILPILSAQATYVNVIYCQVIYCQFWQ